MSREIRPGRGQGARAGGPETTRRGVRRDGPGDRSGEGSPGPYQPLKRAEIARAVPARARRAHGQHEWLTRLGEDPELAQLRADRLRNIAECGRILARYASWGDRTTRPTRARICRLAGVAVSTWKAARRWLEEHGYLGTVRPGWTPALRAAALTSPDDPNSAAVYVLCVPRRRPREESPMTDDQVTRPLTPSRSDGGNVPAREAPKNPVAVLRQGPGQKLSDEHVAALARPFLVAGWSGADLDFAVHHDPERGRYRMRLAGVLSPAHWLAWRLSRWTTEPDWNWYAFRKRGRWPGQPFPPKPIMSPSQRQWADVKPIGDVYLERNRARAAAAANHGPSAAWREARAALERRRTRGRP